MGPRRTRNSSMKIGTSGSEARITRSQVISANKNPASENPKKSTNKNKTRATQKSIVVKNKNGKIPVPQSILLVLKLIQLVFNQS